MDINEAITFLRPALPVSGAGGAWIDVGAGTGLFTRALAALLGPDALINALDRDTSALASLRKQDRSAPSPARIKTITADMVDLLALDDLAGHHFDGALFANSLHFAQEAERVLSDVAQRIQKHGKIVVIEYNRTVPSRWVPYPIAKEKLARLAQNLPLTPPQFVSSHPSTFGGQIYCAVLHKQDPD